jgi:carboxypeptidase Q
LWGGEEEGLYGSLAYVQQHFAPRDTMKKTPEYDKLSVYFNDDSGSGKFRAVSALGNAELAAIFQSWIAPIKDLGLEAVTGLTAGPTLAARWHGLHQFLVDRPGRHRFHAGSA